MKNNYQLFKDWETEKSHLLAEGLKIKAEEILKKKKKSKKNTEAYILLASSVITSSHIM